MKVLFIGMGNMGGAIIKSIFKHEDLAKELEIYGAKNTQKTFDEINKHGKLNLFFKEDTDKMDIVFIGVKPKDVEFAINSNLIKEKLNENTIVVSMAAGITLDYMERILGETRKVIRIMPNLPVLVQEGMTSLTGNKNIQSSDLEKIKKILSPVSKCVVVKEEDIHAFIGMAGSSPAFVFMLIEAMSDIGVKYGLTREDSYIFASQGILGACKMVLESKENPGKLKDKVCSPGGTTIEGVIALEENGFRSSIMKGIEATILKSKKMSEKS